MQLGPFVELKDLKNLATLCRKYGIKHYKSNELELSFTEDAPIVNRKSRIAKSKVESTEEQLGANLGDLSDEQLLFWSNSSIPGEAQ